jgi:hypothetical protein
MLTKKLLNKLDKLNITRQYLREKMETSEGELSFEIEDKLELVESEIDLILEELSYYEINEGDEFEGFQKFQI